MTKKIIVNNCTLDKNQLKVVTSNSNTLVIAGAGAGKTLTIIGKINYLIENNICNCKDILLISFTNASVNDIKLKLRYNIDVFTFHKLAINILCEKNIEYTIAQSNLLEYTVKEMLYTASFEEQKIILNFLNIGFTYNEFLNSHYFYGLINLIIKFINQYKTNNLSYFNIKNIKYTNTEKRMILFIFRIYLEYIQQKNSVNSLDYDDLIITASKIAQESNLKYKYIIIDEFQDTSKIRLNLIYNVYSKGSRITVVGDDWQSIYRFSGCDLDIFLNFDKLFPKVKAINLVNTYRNSIELIELASIFIQKNPLQIKKKLISPKSKKDPVVFIPYKNKKQTLKKLLNNLLIQKKANDLMIIYRNKKDIYEYIDNEYIFSINTLIFSEKNIKHFTVHKSKGLEADHVIILNCNDEMLGFPNQLEDHPIIKKIINNNEISYGEERRLFYVALTRCKENVYLLYDKNRPSIFIKELKKIIKKQHKKIVYFKD